MRDALGRRFQGNKAEAVQIGPQRQDVQGWGERHIVELIARAREAAGRGGPATAQR